VVYWLSTLALIALGYVTGFSIGPFILLIAVPMLLLGPFRHRAEIYWPPMAVVVGFAIGDLAVGPLTCEATSDSAVTVCTSLFGIVHYTGTGAYNPPHQPGIIAGLLLGGVMAALVAIGIRWAGQWRLMGRT
jgi:hypothetical protein